MTAPVRVLTRTAVFCALGWPFAVAAIVVAIYTHERVEAERAKREKDGRGLWLEREYDDTAEFDWDAAWLTHGFDE